MSVRVESRGRRSAGPGVVNPRVRAIARMLVGLCLSLAVIGFAGPADAATAPNGATWYPVHTYCNVYSNYMTRDLYAAPQPGWTSQRVAFRTYLLNTRTQRGAWSAWGQTRVYRNPGSTVPIGGGLLLPDGASFRLYTEIMWWNGERWTSRVGSWDVHFTNAGGGYVRSNACMT